MEKTIKLWGIWSSDSKTNGAGGLKYSDEEERKPSAIDGRATDRLGLSTLLFSERARDLLQPFMPNEFRGWNVFILQTESADSLPYFEPTFGELDLIDLEASKVIDGRLIVPAYSLRKFGSRSIVPRFKPSEFSLPGLTVVEEVRSQWKKQKLTGADFEGVRVRP